LSEQQYRYGESPPPLEGGLLSIGLQHVKSRYTVRLQTELFLNFVLGLGELSAFGLLLKYGQRYTQYSSLATTLYGLQRLILRNRTIQEHNSLLI